ncbi:MAG: tetratricopeptide repeat protein, partial [Planctomycetota bacterium]
YALAAQAKSGLYQAHRAGARELERLGRYDEAAECYRGALEALSEKSKYRTLRAQFLLRLGELLTQAGKHSESEREFQRCLEVKAATKSQRGKMNTHHARAHVKLARLLRNRQQFNEAIDHYEQALELNPSNQTAQRDLEETIRQRDRLRGSPPAP